MTLTGLCLFLNVGGVNAAIQTLAIPPDEFQNGGAKLFEHLKPLNETHPKIFIDGDQTPGHRLSERVYFNQPIKLDLLGPGVSIAFVADRQGNFIWAISNGRFDQKESNGSLLKNTYPIDLVAPQQPDEKHLLGKYVWPQDSDGNYLPGSKLVPSNGVHEKLGGGLLRIHNYNEVDMAAGHVSVGADGSAVIGYISGQNKIAQNQNHKIFGDERALDPHWRSFFHESIARAFSGRKIQQIIKKAPVDFDGIRQENARFYFPERNRFRGPEVYDPPEFAFFTPEQVIHILKRMGSRGEVTPLRLIATYGPAAFKGNPEILSAFHKAFGQAVAFTERNRDKQAPVLRTACGVNFSKLH